MRKTIALLILFTLFFATSCSRGISPTEVLTRLCKTYPIDATVYSSLASPQDEGYIDEQMLTMLFGLSDPSGIEIAFVSYGDVGTVREIGIFSARGSEERMYLFELASDRISFLSTFVDGEGFVKKYRGVIAYGFVDDAIALQKALDALLG